MKKLITIQKRNNLNEVIVLDPCHPVNKGFHNYIIVCPVNDRPNYEYAVNFQNGPYATRENALAITAIEEALMWMNKRAEDRFEANTLGTNKI